MNNNQLMVGDAMQANLGFVESQTAYIEAGVYRTRFPAVRYPGLIPVDYSAPEWIKTITTTLMGSHPIVVLDNVGREIYSDELAQVLTADIWTCRILGTNQSARVANRTVWVANGNNIKVRGDFSSRCYWIRLESKTSRPWERSNFSIQELPQHVRENRGEIIAAVLTLARGWWAAGRGCDGSAGRRCSGSATTGSGDAGHGPDVPMTWSRRGSR